MIYNRKSLSTIRIGIITLLFFIVACSKNDDETIPNVPVNFTIYLTLPQYSSLNSIASHAIVNDYGYRGIVIYRRSQDEFVAFDLACPKDPSNTMIVDSSGINTVDLSCGSKFLLEDGSVLNGPATRPMKQYNTEYQPNNNTVSIYN